MSAWRLRALCLVWILLAFLGASCVGSHAEAATRRLRSSDRTAVLAAVARWRVRFGHAFDDVPIDVSVRIVDSTLPPPPAIARRRLSASEQSALRRALAPARVSFVRDGDTARSEISDDVTLRLWVLELSDPTYDGVEAAVRSNLTCGRSCYVEAPTFVRPSGGRWFAQDDDANELTHAYPSEAQPGLLAAAARQRVWVQNSFGTGSLPFTKVYASDTFSASGAQRLSPLEQLSITVALMPAPLVWTNEPDVRKNEIARKSSTPGSNRDPSDHETAAVLSLGSPVIAGQTARVTSTFYCGMTCALTATTVLTQSDDLTWRVSAEEGRTIA